MGFCQCLCMVVNAISHAAAHWVIEEATVAVIMTTVLGQVQEPRVVVERESSFFNRDLPALMCGRVFFGVWSVG